VAITAARGRIILFVDDDVIPSTDLLEGHVAAYEDSSVGGVAGRILGPGEDDSCAARLPPRNWLSINFNMLYKTPVATARGCNMSFRKDILLAIGGFDTEFRRPFFLCEDSDVCFTIREKGFELLFEPSACLRHLEAKSGGTRAPKRPASKIRAEFWMYRQHFCHYRDNLYFLCKHFRGSQRLRYVLRAYKVYVGVSRWPWRLVAKNLSFGAALFSAVLRQNRKRSQRLEFCESI
jgi:GT2 family glycosyltransferase